MSKIKFTKIHSAGNHYVYLFTDPLYAKNTLTSEYLSPKYLAQLAVKISHPKYGVGSDGLVLLAKGNQTKIKMRMFNADGSESAMCGNAICSVAKLLYERGIEKKSEFSIELGNSSYPVKLWFDKVQKIKKVTVQIGAPDLEMKDFVNPGLLKKRQIKKQRTWIEHDFSHFFKESLAIKSKMQHFKGTLVSFNNPHLVIFCEDIDKIPLKDWGAEIERNALFPQGINIEFVQKINSKEVRQRTWERGSGETWACGSGACAVCVAGFLSKKTENKILIHLLGGDLQIEWKQEKQQQEDRKQEQSNVLLTGEPVEVFSGEFIT